MITTLYNAETESLSPFYEGGYIVDNEHPEIELPWYELEVIQQPQPMITQTQRVVGKWVIDLEKRQYRYEVEVLPLSDAEIAMLRQERYKAESDSMFIAYNKYKELGLTEKAEEWRVMWINKVTEIDQTFPYAE